MKNFKLILLSMLLANSSMAQNKHDNDQEEVHNPRSLASNFMWDKSKNFYLSSEDIRDAVSKDCKAFTKSFQLYIQTINNNPYTINVTYKNDPTQNKTANLFVMDYEYIKLCYDGIILEKKSLFNMCQEFNEKELGFMSIDHYSKNEKGAHWFNNIKKEYPVSKKFIPYVESYPLFQTTSCAVRNALDVVIQKSEILQQSMNTLSNAWLEEATKEVRAMAKWENVLNKKA